MVGSRRALLLDVALAVLVGIGSWFAAQTMRWMQTVGRMPWGRGDERWTTPPVGSYEVWWTPLPFVLVVMAGLAMRRVRTPLAFVVVAVGASGYLALGAPLFPVLLAPMLTAYVLAAVVPVRQWVWWGLLLVPMLTARYWSEPAFGLTDPQFYGTLVVGSAAVLVPAMVGLLRRNRQQAQQAEREEELRRYAYEERLRVAREVHDVVGHSLSVISLQAGVALHVLERRPDQAAASLAAIRDTSRDGLAELRSTLAVFRDPDAPLAPQAGLDRLDALVAALRTAGRDIEVEDHRTVGSTEPLPAAIDLAALRIVQESLTNVVRHTGSARASVRIADEAGRLLITVTDDGPIGPPLAEGSGIAGMRERARAVGGTATVERLPTGGVRVSADLPRREQTP